MCTYFSNCAGLEKNISIESSADSPIAGERFVITCTIISDRPAQLTWKGRNGLPIRENNPSVYSQVTSGMLTSVKLIFQPLYTSHAGIYTCISLVGSNINSKTYSVRVQSKFACKKDDDVYSDMILHVSLLCSSSTKDNNQT